MADGGAGVRADTRWLTYEEAGHVLRIDPDSVARRARRQGWPRQPGNDGKTRVGVPPDVLPRSAPDSGPDREADGADKSTPDGPGTGADMSARTKATRSRLWKPRSTASGSAP